MYVESFYWHIFFENGKNMDKLTPMVCTYIYIYIYISVQLHSLGMSELFIFWIIFLLKLRGSVYTFSGSCRMQHNTCTAASA